MNNGHADPLEELRAAATAWSQLAGKPVYICREPNGPKHHVTETKSPPGLVYVETVDAKAEKPKPKGLFGEQDYERWD